MGHKEWRDDGKTITRCYTIALKLWDEFNANFVLLYFSSYRSIKIWHPYFKNVKKKAIRQCIKTQTFSILRNILPWYFRKFVHVLFCVLQTNLNKVDILCKLSDWIRNIQIIQCFNTIKTWLRILHG